MRNPFDQNVFIKIQKILLFLFILLLPTQFGKHFFFPFSYVSGIRIDYLAPTIYILDILIVLLIISVAPKLYKIIKKNHQTFLLFCGLIFLNIIFSPQPILGLYGAVKLFEVVLIGVVFYILRPSFSFILIPFTIAACFEFFLSISQFITHGSLQGIFYLFGERYLNMSVPGIAKTSLFGRELLRPYATFSHPNSMGVFYLLLYVFILTSTRTLTGFLNSVRNVLLLLCGLIVLISFSKTAIILYVIITLYFIISTSKHRCLLCKFARIFGLLSVSGLFLSASRSYDAVNERFSVIYQGINTLLKHPILGVGISQNISALSHFPSQNPYFFLQPIHNIFVLMFVEWGILLTLFVFWFLWKIMQKKMSKSLFFVLFTIGASGMMDHYWITLEQNMLLVGLVIGYIITKTNPTTRIGFVKD